MRGELLSLAFFNIAKALLWPPPRSPQMVVAAVNCDLREPGLERGGMRPVITPEREVGFGETILNDFLDLVALCKKTAGHTRNLTTMPLEQLFESTFVTAGGRGDQNIICRFRRLHSVRLRPSPSRLSFASLGHNPTDAITGRQGKAEAGNK